MVGGATLTGLLGTSAWYAPGASVAYLVDSILNDQKKMIACSVYLEGEYGQSDICVGVPKSPVRVAPPTIVSAATFCNTSSERNSVTGIPL